MLQVTLREKENGDIYYNHVYKKGTDEFNWPPSYDGADSSVNDTLTYKNKNVKYFLGTDEEGIKQITLFSI